MIAGLPEEPRRDDEPPAPAGRRYEQGLLEQRLLEQLLEHQGAWMRRQVRYVATAFEIDADELLQETLLSLLRSTVTVDLARPGVRSWLNKQIRWRAADLYRRDRVARGTVLHPEDLDEEVNRVVAASAPSSADELHEVAAQQQRLQEIGLTSDQAKALAMRISGFELTLKEFSELVGRPYAKTRQDYSRGLRRVQDWFGLTPDETRAFTTYRRSGSVEQAAAQLGLTVDELRSILDRVNKKVDEAFSGSDTAAALTVRESPWDDPYDAAGEALERTRAYLRSWGILDPQAVPTLLVCLERCRANYENPSRSELYRPSRDWRRNRLDLILDGPDIQVGALKTWQENGARVWREVLAELQRVHPGLHRPGRPNAPGAQKDLRRLYASLKIVDVWLRTTPPRPVDGTG